MSDAAADEIVVYRYRDTAGRDVFTNEPAAVPRELQGTLVEVDMGPRVPASSAMPDEIGGVHLASAALGASITLAALLLPKVLRRGRWLVRIGGVVVAMAVVGGLYFGWVMRTAGLGSGGALGDPRDLIEEARRAAKATEDSARARERNLDTIR